MLPAEWREVSELLLETSSLRLPSSATAGERYAAFQSSMAGPSCSFLSLIRTPRVSFSGVLNLVETTELVRHRRFQQAC